MPVEKRRRQAENSKNEPSVSRSAVNFESVRNSFEAMTSAEKLEFVTSNPQYIKSTEETFQILSSQIFNSRKILPKRHKSWFHYYKLLVSKQPKEGVKMRPNLMPLSKNPKTGFDPRHIAAVPSLSVRPTEATTRAEKNRFKKLSKPIDVMNCKDHDTGKLGSKQVVSVSSQYLSSKNPALQNQEDSYGLNLSSESDDDAPFSARKTKENLGNVNNHPFTSSQSKSNSKHSKSLDNSSKGFNIRDENFINRNTLLNDLHLSKESNDDQLPLTPISAEKAQPSEDRLDNIGNMSPGPMLTDFLGTTKDQELLESLMNCPKNDISENSEIGSDCFDDPNFNLLEWCFPSPPCPRRPSSQRKRKTPEAPVSTHQKKSKKSNVL